MSGRYRVLEIVSDFRPDCVLLHHVGDGRLLSVLQNRYPTVEFVHGFACAGSKLFRRRDRICEHPVSTRCLFDWYRGPCGSDRSPRAAISNLREARDYIRGLALIDLVIVASQFMKRYLIGEGLNGHRIEVVDTAIGIPPAIPVERRITPERHLVYVGRTVYAKGIQYLIRALAILGSQYRLTIVGEGWYLMSLKSLAKELGIEQRVKFLGALQGEALGKVLDTATLGVVPSIWPEPAGMVVPEFRSHGLPVVVTGVGGLKEWAGRYSDTHLAEPANVASLAAAIQSAVQGNVEDLVASTAARPMDLTAVLEVLHARRTAEHRFAFAT
jgi:glycosyltransferase involved in cell wall biosynthesis